MKPGTVHDSPQSPSNAYDALAQLNAEAWGLLTADPGRSRALCDQVLALIQDRRVVSSADFSREQAQCLLILSILEWDQSNYDRALELALEARALFISARDIRQQAFTTNHMAGIYYFLGDFSRALDLGLEALELAVQSNDRALLASCLNDTAYVRLHLGQFDEALPQLFDSLAIQRELGDRHGETQTLESLGKAYYLMGDYRRALDYEFQSLDISRAIDYRRTETEALHNLGKIYVASGQVELAQQMLEQAYDQANARGYRQFEAAILVDLGLLALDTGTVETAEETLLRALEIAQGIRSRPVILDARRALARCYERAGEYLKALDFYKQFHDVREALLTEHNRIILHSLQVRHQLEQARSEAEIAHLRNVELQRQIDEREQLIADLDAFAHTVAHDLKNPLATIAGYADLLSSVVDEDPALAGHPLLGEATRTLTDASLKAVRIVDELLLLASVRSQDITLEAIDMGALVAQVQRQLAEQIRASGATVITPDRWPVALGYAPWIEQVWINYFTNALKYGGKPPIVTLGATVEGDRATFWVKDNGDGVPPDKQYRLFAQFDRLGTSQAKGHGLGLSIVKRIVEKLDGTVAVESSGQPGEGAIFMFTLIIVPDAGDPDAGDPD